MKRLKILVGVILCFFSGFSVMAEEKSLPPAADGETITNSIGMALKLIRPGHFIMGSGSGYKDEMPTHKVTISTPFYLGIHEVTQKEYETVMGENPSKFPNPDAPVESISWENAVAFCLKLSKRENVTYRLPTEAEWEYSCRAGTTTDFFWGDAENGEFFWFKDNSDGETHPAGTRKPNPWGLYDMSGNAWEYCHDWYAEGYAPDDQQDPTGPPTGHYRVLRGGSWIDWPRGCRSTERFGYGPAYQSDIAGFRVARSVAKP